MGGCFSSDEKQGGVSRSIGNKKVSRLQKQQNIERRFALRQVNESMEISGKSQAVEKAILNARRQEQQNIEMRILDMGHKPRIIFQMENYF